MTEQVINKTLSQSSVEFSTTSKGIYSFVVKAYADDPVEALRLAMKIAQDAESFVKAKNPIESHT